jgi:hypothetical protein
MMLAPSAPVVEMTAHPPPHSIPAALHERTPSVSASNRLSVSSSSSSSPISTSSSRVLVSPATGGHKPRVSSHAANTLLLSALHRQNTIKRLQTIQGLSNATSQSQAQQPVVARQLPSRGSQQTTGARLASASLDDDGLQHGPPYMPIMRVDDALLFYAPTRDDRSQRGYQLMPCMDSSQEHQRKQLRKQHSRAQPAFCHSLISVPGVLLPVSSA